MNLFLRRASRACRSILLYGTVFLFPVLIHAGPLTGKTFRLVDAATAIPVPDARIQSIHGGRVAASDDNGYFSPDTTVASDTLIIRAPGYRSLEISTDSLHATQQGIIRLSRAISSLDEVVVSAVAGKGIFRTISDLDIHLRPVNNSQEVLRIVPGLFIGQHAGGGKSEQIFLRGFDIDHGTDIAITVDGLPVNMVSHAHGQGYADLHWVIPELVEKADFNKGPYFAEKGNLATAGYVDFRTRNYLDRSFVKLEGGQYNTFRGIAGLNLLSGAQHKRGQSLFAAGEFSSTRGYFDSPQDFRRYNGMLRYHGNVSPASTLTATLTGFTSTWLASGQVPERAVDRGAIGFYGAIDNTEGGATSRYNAIVNLSTRLPHAGRLQQTAFYTRNLFELYSNFTFFKEDPVNGDQIRQKETRDLYGYSAAYTSEYTAAGIRMTTRAGVQLRYDRVNNLELSRTAGRSITTAPLMLGAVREGNAGAYWTQVLDLRNGLTISPGIRADWFTNRYDDALQHTSLTSGTALLSPKLRLDYSPNERTQLYLYGGRGFHTNDTRVAVQQNGKQVAPPAWGADLGGFLKPAKKFLLQAAVWYLWLDQEFVYVGDEGVVEPGGRTVRTGVDLSLRYEIVPGLFADADLSLARPKALDVPEAESHLPLAPLFTSTGGLTYRRLQGLNGSLRYRLMGDRPANERNSVIAKGYCIVDAALNYTRPRWEAGVAVQNLLNSRWKETQFDTESRLQNEPAPVSGIHFTPGTPFFGRISLTVFF